MATARNESAGGLRTERIQALCDGVFAVAMTLLVLDIRVPRLAAHLPRSLYNLRVALFSYALSFLVLGVYWIGHHNQFHYIRRADRFLLWINIAFFAAVALIPFSAALLAKYPGQRSAVVVYGANLIVVGLLLYLHWWYATREHRLVDADMPETVVALAARRILMAPVAYLGAIVLALFHPAISLVIYVLVPVLYVLPARFDRHFMHPGREREAEAGEPAG